MIPQKKDTWFEAFFRAVTASPELRDAITKDWKWESLSNLESSLTSLQKSTHKASDLLKWFWEAFTVSEWPNQNTETSGKKTGDVKSDEGEFPIDVQHFTMKNPALWWFTWVAGMESLKEELRNSFIKPLKFKFLVEKYKAAWRENSTVTSLIDTEKDKVTKEAYSKDTTNQWSDVWNTNTQKMLLQLHEAYEKFQISIPTGLLFYGPPWTGKTFITKKLAEELECGFISKNMGEFWSSYIHQTTKNIRDFFAGAKKASEKEPIILFLDEIDSLVSARTDRIDANKAEEVSQFLQEFNALEEAKNLIVIAATNRPDHLDPALLRSWRLDKKVYIWPPDVNARKELFRMYIEKLGRPHSRLDYNELAILTEWYVSADIETICDEGARQASHSLLEFIDEAEWWILPAHFDSRNTITMQLLKKVIKETPSSLKMVDMSIYENWLEKLK